MTADLDSVVARVQCLANGCNLLPRELIGVLLMRVDDDLELSDPNSKGSGRLNLRAGLLPHSGLTLIHGALLRQSGPSRDHHIGRSLLAGDLVKFPGIGHARVSVWKIGVLTKYRSVDSGRRGKNPVKSKSITFLYWSDRRIRNVASDCGIKIERGGDATLKSPRIPGLPQAEWKQRDPVPARSATAEKIEKGVRGDMLSDFGPRSSGRFAKGLGTVFFSELTQGADVTMISAGAEGRTPQGDPVAICMFGSFENLTEVLTNGDVQRYGWSSSSLRHVARFMETELLEPNECFGTDAGLAYAAAQIVFESGGDDRYPWRRGFTYGHLRDVGEWFMEVFLDISIAPEEVPPQYHSLRRFRRIIVGAPLWIRTPTEKALRVYNQCRLDELDAEARSNAGSW